MYNLNLSLNRDNIFSFWFECFQDRSRFATKFAPPEREKGGGMKRTLGWEYLFNVLKFQPFCLVFGQYILDFELESILNYRQKSNTYLYLVFAP
jgi:hypothetical protein